MDLHSAIVTAIVALFSAMAFGESLPADARERAVALWATIESNETNGAITMPKVRNLTTENRYLLKHYFKDFLEDYVRRGRTGDDDVVLKLAMMGDDEARDSIVATWVRNPWNYPSDLLRLESPEAIAQFGELLFMNEQDRMPSDVGYIAPQRSAYMLVIATLKGAPVFSGDVREWAYRVWDTKGSLDMVRKWYRENEARLKGGDFQAVQPGPSPPPEERPEPAAAPPAMANSASPNAVAMPVTEPIAQPASTSSEWSFAAIAAVAVALLVGLVVFWKRRV